MDIHVDNGSLSVFLFFLFFFGALGTSISIPTTAPSKRWKKKTA